MKNGLMKNGLISGALLCCGLLSGVVHAVDCTGIPEWNAATVYPPPPPSNRVQHQNVGYQNNFWTQNDNPASRNGGPGSGQPWTSIGPCDGGNNPVPGAPTNFSAILSSTSAASLVWSDNTGSEDEFQIQRSINAGPFAQVGSNGRNDNTFTDSNLSCGTTYTYRVRARIGTGVTDWSNTGSVTTGTCGGVIVPGAPTNFDATLSGSSSNLTWNDNTTAENEFQIQRSVNGGAFGQVGSNGSGDTTFTDSGLSCGTTYAYRVRARVGNNVTDWSNTDSVTTGSCGTGAGCPVWNINKSYRPGDIVLSRASFFRAKNPVPPQNGFPSAGFFWDQLPSCPGGYPQSPGGPGLAGVLTEQQFNLMFPGRAPFYTYQGLLNATARPQLAIFGNTGSLNTRKLEVVYALANFEHETGALAEVEEGTKNVMCDIPSSGQWPCAPGQRYFGRGPIQLSWNFNYGPAGAFLNLPLLQNPGLVSSDPSVAWQSALWYWVTQNGPGDRPAHRCVIDNQGFGCTIRTINGALECSTPQNPAGNPATVASRIEALTDFRIILGIPRTTSEGPESCIGN